MRQIGEKYETATLDKYVIMPNHIHMILVLNPTECNGRRPYNIHHCKSIQGHNRTRSAPTVDNYRNFVRILTVKVFLFPYARFAIEDFDRRLT